MEVIQVLHMNKGRRRNQREEILSVEERTRELGADADDMSGTAMPSTLSSSNLSSPSDHNSINDEKETNN